MIKSFNLDAEIANAIEDLAALYGFKSTSALVEYALTAWLNSANVTLTGQAGTPAALYAQFIAPKRGKIGGL